MRFLTRRKVAVAGLHFKNFQVGFPGQKIYCHPVAFGYAHSADPCCGMVNGQRFPWPACVLTYREIPKWFVQNFDIEASEALRI